MVLYLKKENVGLLQQILKYSNIKTIKSFRDSVARQDDFGARWILGLDVCVCVCVARYIRRAFMATKSVCNGESVQRLAWDLCADDAQTARRIFIIFKYYFLYSITTRSVRVYRQCASLSSGASRSSRRTPSVLIASNQFGWTSSPLVRSNRVRRTLHGGQRTIKIIYRPGVGYSGV